MKIQILAAHPDDEALGMGGTIKKLSKNGNDINIAFLSTGIMARRPMENHSSKKIMTKKFITKMNNRVKELQKDAKKSAKIMGINHVEFYDFPDNEMDTVSNLEITKTIESIISSFKPSIIYTPPQLDVNVDHQSLFYATLTATRPKKNTPVRKVYSYEIISSTEWYFPARFTPNVFVDISNEIKTKIKALEAYKNEIQSFPHPRSKISVDANARKWGSVSGYNYAEAFSLVRSLE